MSGPAATHVERRLTVPARSAIGPGSFRRLDHRLMIAAPRAPGLGSLVCSAAWDPWSKSVILCMFIDLEGGLDRFGHVAGLGSDALAFVALLCRRRLGFDPIDLDEPVVDLAVVAAPVRPIRVGQRLRALKPAEVHKPLDDVVVYLLDERPHRQAVDESSGSALPDVAVGAFSPAPGPRENGCRCLPTPGGHGEDVRQEFAFGEVGLVLVRTCPQAGRRLEEGSERATPHCASAGK